MQVTTNILLIIISAGIAFTFGMVKLGINRLIKGQDEAKVEGMKRVNKIRDDISNIGVRVQKHSTRLAVLETRCDINHGRRKDDDV